MAVAAVNGTRLWYEVAGEGPPLVLLHAGLVDSRMWDEHVPALAVRHRVIRYDLRSFGRSSRPDGPFSHADDLLALLDELGVERAALVGASLGGRVAIDVALSRPERVRALVLVASGLGGFPLNPFTREQLAELEASFERGEFERVVDLELVVWAPLGVDGRLRRIAHDQAHVNALEDFERRLDPPAIERLAEIRVPALVVTGDRDVPQMTEIGDVLEREIRGACRAVVEGADHLLPLRRQDEFVRLVLDFLASTD